MRHKKWMRRRRTVGYTAAVIAALVVVGLLVAFTVHWVNRGHVDTAQAAPDTELFGAAKPASAYPDPPPIVLPANARAVFIGDSWTEGYNATPESKGFAYLTEAAMGWTGPVLGASGTGYTKGKGEVPNYVPAYADRIKSFPEDQDTQIVIIQGSGNDLHLADTADFVTIADKVITTAKAKFPKAAIVLVGPCATAAPPDTRLQSLDRHMQAAARRNVLHYVSCAQEDWINAANVATVIDPQTGHPSTEGHAYLAERLTADLRSFITVQ